MQQRYLDNIQRHCSNLVLGTMAFNEREEDRWYRLLDTFVSLGGNCIDTAVSYYGGQSERVIGRWLEKRGVAEDMIILTKGAHPKSDGLPRVRPECIEEDLTESLEKLKLDSVDLYLLHRDDPDVPVDELVDALNDQARRGRIKAFGGSNWTTQRLEAANEYARKHQLMEFTMSSPNLSLAVPKGPRWAGCISLTTDDLSWYEQTQMTVFSWSSQASGFFTGRFSRDRIDDEEFARFYYTQDNWDRYDRAEKLAQAKGLTTNQVALGYVLSQPFPTFALIGPLTVDELKVSASGGDIQLTLDEVTWLDGRSQVAPPAVS